MTDTQSEADASEESLAEEFVRLWESARVAKAVAQEMKAASDRANEELAEVEQYLTETIDHLGQTRVILSQGRDPEIVIALIITAKAVSAVVVG